MRTSVWPGRRVLKNGDKKKDISFDKKDKNTAMNRRLFVFYALILLLCGFVYVSQYWSPSSYGLVLRQIGEKDTETVLGKPRPIRSDEWAVVTPLTQATVNNHFERMNKTSLYGEDLRINYGLPIFDWGLIFKPTMWGYLVTDPAHAYSFHWFAVLALFIIGYALLFVKLGFDEKQSILLSVMLYFTGFTQFWWNEKGPIFAFFPWVVWVLLLRLPVMVRLPLLYWLGASWLITNFYPPVFLSLTFVGVLIILAVGREWLNSKKFMLLLAATASAAVTVAMYLKDYLLQTSTTLYPGGRNVGGGSVPWQEWWSQIFPFATFDWRYESVIGQNICEVGVVGSAFVLMTLCFLDYSNVLKILRERNETRRQLLIFGGGLILMTAWMILPLPAWTGIPFLWNNVQPERMEYAAGMLLLLFIAILGRHAGIVVTSKRMVVYLVLVLVGWLVLKQISLNTNVEALLFRSNDLLVIPIILLALVLNRRSKLSQYNVLLAASAICGALALFWFNPIQSSKNFFIRHDTSFMRAIEAEVRQPQGGPKYLAFSGMAGATLNGLGYASVSHVTAVPALNFWRNKYPSMKENDFLQIFNRYSHISLIFGKKPVVIQADNVGVPLADFWPDRIEIPADVDGGAVPLWLQQGHSTSGYLRLNRAGCISVVSVFIGNGYNSADGVMILRLCKAKECVSVSRNLSESLDNAYLHFKLAKPLMIDRTDTMQYEFQLRAGTHPVAFWTYKAARSDSVTLIMDGNSMSSVPRFMIQYLSENDR
jgi:hypothetical protein